MTTKQYMPILVSAIAVLLVGYWNPKMLRAKPTATSTISCTEHTDFKWLALIALVAGAATVMLTPSLKGYQIV